MYSPLHASTGFLLAQFAPNATVAFVVGVASHYVLDAIPHGDMRPLQVLQRMSKGKSLAIAVPIDLGLAFLTYVFLSSQVDWSAKLFWGALGGITPDLLWGGKFLLERLGLNIPFLIPLLRWHNVFHEGVHAKEQYDLPHRFGIAYQIVLLAGLVSFYLLK